MQKLNTSRTLLPLFNPSSYNWSSLLFFMIKSHKLCPSVSHRRAVGSSETGNREFYWGYLGPVSKMSKALLRDTERLGKICYIIVGICENQLYEDHLKSGEVVLKYFNVNVIFQQHWLWFKPVISKVKHLRTFSFYL